MHIRKMVADMLICNVKNKYYVIIIIIFILFNIVSCSNLKSVNEKSYLKCHPTIMFRDTWNDSVDYTRSAYGIKCNYLIFWNIH